MSYSFAHGSYLKFPRKKTPSNPNGDLFKSNFFVNKNIFCSPKIYVDSIA